MFYLFHGEDEFSRSETLADFKKKMGDPGLAGLNITIFDGNKVTLGELQHACDSVPFMAERRLVIVEGLLNHLESRRISWKDNATDSISSRHLSICLTIK